MGTSKLVLIGIQARSTSERLPNKIHMPLDGIPILERIIHVCKQAGDYLNRNIHSWGVRVEVVVLCPKGDALVDTYKGTTMILQGDEKDVLHRYAEAALTLQADLIVRITADCPFMASHVISRHIKSAISKKQDYTTNVLIRTFMEGQDVEVLSRRLLLWLEENARSPEDREHVTLLLNRLYHEKRFPFESNTLDGRPSIHHVLNEFDYSDIKTSVDTQEDFETAEAMFLNLRKKNSEARTHGTV